MHGLDNRVSRSIISDSSFVTWSHDVLIKRILSIFSSKPGLLVTSERYVRRHKGARVHKHGSSLELVRGFNSPGNVLAENICSKTINRIVCLLDDIFVKQLN